MFYRLVISGGKLFVIYLRKWWRIDHGEEGNVRSNQIINVGKPLPVREQVHDHPVSAWATA